MVYLEEGMRVCGLGRICRRSVMIINKVSERLNMGTVFVCFDGEVKTDGIGIDIVVFK